MTENPEISLEAAQAVLQMELEKKQKACVDEITEVLNKHGFALDVVRPQIIIVPAQQE